jgi:hypothetical protein
MKLSEAILLGSMIRPQCGALFMDGKSCAMGAALEAYGIPYNEDTSCDSPVLAALPRFSQSIAHLTDCPVCKGSVWEDSGYKIVEHLNDYHRWTRECIAAWVATVELPEPSLPQEVQHNQILESMKNAPITY